MMRAKTMLLVLVALMSLAGVAAADILWDQTAGYESWQQGFFNVIAGGPPMGITMYSANDITVPAGGWVVDTYRTIYDGFDASWAGAVTQAVFYFEPKTGSTPAGDPTTGIVVPVTATVLSNNFLEVTATGLNTVLAEGDYWVCLTPYAPNANNIFVSVPAVGDATPSYDPFGFPMPMWGPWVPGFDGAIMLEGTTGAVAVEENTFGSLKALYR